MEILNKKQKAIQDNQTVITEGDDGIEFKVSQITPQFALDWSYDTFVKKHPHYDWQKKNYNEIKRWLDYTLKSDYNPEKLKFIGVEHFFDYEVDEDWGKYEYKVQGKTIEGKLKIRGTLDALIEHNDSFIEYEDYKSGRYMFDWKLNREKTPEELYHDPQLLLYYFSLKKIFPQFEHIGMTLFWTKGGPVPLIFGKEEYQRAENLLKKTFATIKNDNKAKWIFYDDAKNHQCSYCSFNQMVNPDSGKTTCKHVHDEIVTLGIDKVTDKYIDLEKTGNYEGGGAIRNV